ncbi:MAG: GNAT family N-acetyltransferase [Chthonomonadales bacterium]
MLHPIDEVPAGEIRVRLALISEQRLLESLQLRASLNNPGDREAILANPDAIEVPAEQIVNGCVFVAEVAGSISGFVALIPREDTAGELDALFVEPDNWRRGVGRALIEHCIQVARSHGWTSIHVIGNPHAEGFYAACGFERVGIQQMRFGVGHLLRLVLQEPDPSTRRTQASRLRPHVPDDHIKC